MSDEPRKRSRFDQDGDSRRSRFDRRSRSPSTRNSEPARDRSPARETESPSSKVDSATAAAAAAAAQAAAARINAQIQAKKASQPDVPVRAPATRASADVKSPPAESNIGDIYQQDGDYIKDIEVNDLRNRYTLTKGSTQKMIKDKTGADVTTRGAYYPDKSLATASNPPLYLHITSTSKDGLERAIAEIDELMKQELPNLIDERRFRRREPDYERDEKGRRKWPEEKIPIDLEPIPGFNLRAQVVGQGGAYVKHIQQETRCRVQIKGRGSGFYEQSGGEADEPMYLHVAGPDPSEVQRAKELCIDLLDNVRQQYTQFKERGPRGSADHGDRGDRYRNDRDRNDYGSTPQASAMSPTGAANPQDYAAYMQQYQQYYGTSDPYAAYGGYEAYMQMYQQWLASGGQAQTDQSAPPPPSDDQPPPPPSDYNAIPPPPGL